MDFALLLPYGIVLMDTACLMSQRFNMVGAICILYDFLDNVNIYIYIYDEIIRIPYDFADFASIG